VRELLNEFRRFTSTAPATADELTRVYRSSAFSLPAQFETSAAVLDALQANDRFQRPDDYIPSLKDRYAAVSLEDIQGAAGRVLHPERLTWVIVGDRAQIEENLKALEIAELEFMDTDGTLIQ
jgi:zinc protease